MVFHSFDRKNILRPLAVGSFSESLRTGGCIFGYALGTSESAPAGLALLFQKESFFLFFPWVGGFDQDFIPKQWDDFTNCSQYHAIFQSWVEPPQLANLHTGIEMLEGKGMESDGLQLLGHYGRRFSMIFWAVHGCSPGCYGGCSGKTLRVLGDFRRNTKKPGKKNRNLPCNFV